MADVPGLGGGLLGTIISVFNAIPSGGRTSGDAVDTVDPQTGIPYPQLPDDMEQPEVEEPEEPPPDLPQRPVPPPDVRGNPTQSTPIAVYPDGLLPPYYNPPDPQYPRAAPLPSDFPGREYLPREPRYPGEPGTDTWCENYPELCDVDVEAWGDNPIFGNGLMAGVPAPKRPPRPRRPPRRSPAKPPTPRRRPAPRTPDQPGRRARPRLPAWLPGVLRRVVPWIFVPNETSPDDQVFYPPLPPPPSGPRTRPRVRRIPQPRPDDRVLSPPGTYVPPQPSIRRDVDIPAMPTLPPISQPSPASRPRPRTPPVPRVPGLPTLPSLPGLLGVLLGGSPGIGRGLVTFPGGSPSSPPTPSVPSSPIPGSPLSPLTPLQPGVLDLPGQQPVPQEELDRCRQLQKRRKPKRKCIAWDDCGRCTKFKKL